MREETTMAEDGCGYFGCTSETCWEYFGCKKTDCPAHGKGRYNECWDTPKTQCSMLQQFIEMNENKCDVCIYKLTRTLNPV